MPDPACVYIYSANETPNSHAPPCASGDWIRARGIEDIEFGPNELELANDATITTFRGPAKACFPGCAPICALYINYHTRSWLLEAVVSDTTYIADIAPPTCNQRLHNGKIINTVHCCRLCKHNSSGQIPSIRYNPSKVIRALQDLHQILKKKKVRRARLLF